MSSTAKESDLNMWHLFVQSLADKQIQPAYQAFAGASFKLATQIEHWCDQPDQILNLSKENQKQLTEIQQQWLLTQQAWVKARFWTQGPLTEGNLGWKIQFWPDKKNLVGKQVSQKISQPLKQLNQQSLSQAAVPAQGLPAIEQLIFVELMNLKAQSIDQFCLYLKNTSLNLADRANHLSTKWQNQAYQDFTRPFQAEEVTYGSDTRVNEVISGLLESIETSKRRRFQGAFLLEKTANETAKLTSANPYMLEAWKSKKSKEIMIAQLAGLKEFGLFLQEFSQLLPKNEGAIFKRIGLKWTQLAVEGQAHAQVLPMSWFDLIKDRLKISYHSIAMLYDVFQQFEGLLKTQLAKELQVSIGFNSSDGD